MCRHHIIVRRIQIQFHLGHYRVLFNYLRICIIFVRPIIIVFVIINRKLLIISRVFHIGL